MKGWPEVLAVVLTKEYMMHVLSPRICNAADFLMLEKVCNYSESLSHICPLTLFNRCPSLC